MLSHYIKKTKYKNGKEVLFNTVNKKVLELTATEEELKNNHFLAGQEKKCLETYLFKHYRRAMFNIVPTWRCNLRCSHCSVLHLLRKEDDSKIDPIAFYNFVDNYFAKTNVNVVTVLYVGGESMLEVDQCIDLSNILDELGKKHSVEIEHTITTNLAFELTIKHIEFFQKMKALQVSVDGDHEQHNTQRKVFKDKFDCYERTIDNLGKLSQLGLRDVLMVQGAIQDKFFSDENRIKFYAEMLKLGLHFDRIKYASIHPTVLKPNPSQLFERSLTEKARPRGLPCCKFRLLRSLQINPDNTLYDNVYIREFSKLGTLYDSIETLEENHKGIIKNYMPILKDENCMKCPVVGHCWGHCINSYPALKESPSSMCNQAALIKNIDEMAEKGTLLRHNELEE